MLGTIDLEGAARCPEWRRQAVAAPARNSQLLTLRHRQGVGLLNIFTDCDELVRSHITVSRVGCSAQPPFVVVETPPAPEPGAGPGQG